MPAPEPLLPDRLYWFGQAVAFNCRKASERIVEVTLTHRTFARGIFKRAHQEGKFFEFEGYAEGEPTTRYKFFVPARQRLMIARA